MEHLIGEDLICKLFCEAKQTEGLRERECLNVNIAYTDVFLVPIHLNKSSMNKSSSDILLNFSFCVPWKKENHTGLEQHGG